jgi:hypothetical protein
MNKLANLLASIGFKTTLGQAVFLGGALFVAAENAGPPEPLPIRAPVLATCIYMTKEALSFFQRKVDGISAK